MPFKFSYQSVLDYRRHQAEVAEMELARCKGRLVEAEAELEKRNERRKVAAEKMARTLQKGIDGEELHMWRVYVRDLEESIAEATCKVEQMREVVAKARDKLMKATRKKKAVGRLKTSAEQAWQYEEDRKEEKEISEMTIQGVMRKMQ